jgi:hypothetical protein
VAELRRALASFFVSSALSVYLVAAGFYLAELFADP